MRNQKHIHVYKKNFGPIPKDDQDRSFEIHHKDGNPENNDPSNLVALSIQEHYDVHFSQGDYYACVLIARKMKMPGTEISRLAKLSAEQRIANGTHHLLKANRVKFGITNDKHISDTSKIRVAEGTHNFLGKSNPSHRRINDGSHHLLGGKIQKKQLAEGKHPSQQEWFCNTCSKKGRGKGNYTMYHGNNCKGKLNEAH